MKTLITRAIVGVTSAAILLCMINAPASAMAHQSAHDDTVSGWEDYDLSGSIGAPTAVGNPFGYVTAGDIARTLYRTGNNHIIEAYLKPGGTWAWSDLSADTSAPAAVGDPHGYVSAGGILRVVFRSADGHIQELFLKPGDIWRRGDLSAEAGAPPATGDP